MGAPPASGSASSMRSRAAPEPRLSSTPTYARVSGAPAGGVSVSVAVNTQPSPAGCVAFSVAAQVDSVSSAGVSPGPVLVLVLGEVARSVVRVASPVVQTPERDRPPQSDPDRWSEK